MHIAQRVSQLRGLPFLTGLAVDDWLNTNLTDNDGTAKDQSLAAKPPPKSMYERLDMSVLSPGPCGIPENTGIPGLDSNTDTGIFGNKIPVFFGILV